MRLFYGGLKHATTLNRFFFSSLFKLGSVPQEFNSRNTKSENMRNHFCSEDLVRLFQSQFSVRTIGVCQVIPRGIFFPHAMSFWRNATFLNQYVRVVLADLPNVFCWRHPEFNNPHKDFYLADGVHLNPSGQYLLYRSYRGGVLKAVGLLQLSFFSVTTKTFLSIL